jgi:hypothetical protein
MPPSVEPRRGAETWRTAGRVLSALLGFIGACVLAGAVRDVAGSVRDVAGSVRDAANTSTMARSIQAVGHVAERGIRVRGVGLAL